MTTKRTSSLLQSSPLSPSESLPLKRLCQVTLQACEALTPMIVALYNSIESNGSTKDSVVKQKQDASAFTIADGLVQYILTEYLLSQDKFRSIVGEEECHVNLQTLPYAVDNELIVPDHVVPLVDEAKKTIQSLSNELKQEECFKELTVFIDPIDGTREFSTGKGEQCSICVGFANLEGKPVAGVVYRPLTNPCTWVAGAKTEDYFDHKLLSTTARVSAKDDDSLTYQLLTTNGSISPFLQAFLEESSNLLTRQRSGGAGNKMLLLLESEQQEESSTTAAVYIQDRGVSRWDTCAAQACLEAQGGILCKLTCFLLDDAKEESYTYLRSDDTNLDFPGKDIVQFTKYNARNDNNDKLSSSAVVTVTNANEIKPYANVCGLVALGKRSNTKASKQEIYQALQAARQREAPSFN